MTLVQNDLRCDVFGSAADCESSTLIQNLSKAEIGQLEVAIVTNQQVFRLEVPEDNILVVQVFETAGDRRSIEPSVNGIRT